MINRSPSAISRELRRNRDASGGYSARVAQQRVKARRQVCRPMRKLLTGSERFVVAHMMLRQGLPPEQIAGKLRSTYPAFRDACVCRETIYNSIYPLPLGEPRKALTFACAKARRHVDRDLAAWASAANSRR